ncbi:MAG: enoyl-CoA hydratase [Rhodobacterales bacterium]|nr:MAG: enoyl-CoA hydratase [Rhodobacterales bacterium]
MPEKLLIERDGPVAVITLNMPETLNALTDTDLCEDLAAALRDLEADLSIGCAVLTGAGKAFSSGGNVKHMLERSGIFEGDVLDIRDNYRAGIQRLAKAVWGCDLPIIAAVNGAAYGAGCDLTCMCDIRIASQEAQFAENFVRVGLISGDGGGWLLPRTVGLSRACEMSYTGDPIDAETALAWGLVSKVVAAEALLDEAKALAARIARNPARQLRMTKRLLREGQVTRYDSLLELAAAYQGASHHSADHEAAIAALLARKKP